MHPATKQYAPQQSVETLKLEKIIDTVISDGL
jgi:hypothetical protein